MASREKSPSRERCCFPECVSHNQEMKRLNLVKISISNIGENFRSVIRVGQTDSSEVSSTCDPIVSVCATHLDLVNTADENPKTEVIPDRPIDAGRVKSSSSPEERGQEGCENLNSEVIPDRPIDAGPVKSSSSPEEHDEEGCENLSSEVIPDRLIDKSSRSPEECGQERCESDKGCLPNKQNVQSVNAITTNESSVVDHKDILETFDCGSPTRECRPENQNEKVVSQSTRSNKDCDLCKDKDASGELSVVPEGTDENSTDNPKSGNASTSFSDVNELSPVNVEPLIDQELRGVSDMVTEILEKSEPNNVAQPEIDVSTETLLKDLLGTSTKEEPDPVSTEACASLCMSSEASKEETPAECSTDTVINEPPKQPKNLEICKDDTSEEMCNPFTLDTFVKTEDQPNDNGLKTEIGELTDVSQLNEMFPLNASTNPIYSGDYKSNNPTELFSENDQLLLSKACIKDDPTQIESNITHQLENSYLKKEYMEVAVVVPKLPEGVIQKYTSEGVIQKCTSERAFGCVKRNCGKPAKYRSSTPGELSRVVPKIQKNSIKKSVEKIDIAVQFKKSKPSAVHKKHKSIPTRVNALHDIPRITRRNGFIKTRLSMTLKPRTKTDSKIKQTVSPHKNKAKNTKNTHGGKKIKSERGKDPVFSPHKKMTMYLPASISTRTLRHSVVKINPKSQEFVLKPNKVCSGVDTEPNSNHSTKPTSVHSARKQLSEVLKKEELNHILRSVTEKCDEHKDSPTSQKLKTLTTQCVQASDTKYKTRIKLREQTKTKSKKSQKISSTASKITVSKKQTPKPQKKIPVPKKQSQTVEVNRKLPSSLHSETKAEISIPLKNNTQSVCGTRVPPSKTSKIMLPSQSQAFSSLNKTIKVKDELLLQEEKTSTGPTKLVSPKQIPDGKRRSKHSGQSDVKVNTLKRKRPGQMVEKMSHKKIIVDGEWVVEALDPDLSFSSGEEDDSDREEVCTSTNTCENSRFLLPNVETIVNAEQASIASVSAVGLCSLRKPPPGKITISSCTSSTSKVVARQPDFSTSITNNGQVTSTNCDLEKEDVCSTVGTSHEHLKLSTEIQTVSDCESCPALKSTDPVISASIARLQSDVVNLTSRMDRMSKQLALQKQTAVKFGSQLQWYSSNKYHQMLKKVMEDAQPGPNQNPEATFLLDLLESYVPREDLSKKPETEIHV